MCYEDIPNTTEELYDRDLRGIQYYFYCIEYTGTNSKIQNVLKKKIINSIEKARSDLEKIIKLL